MWNIFYTETSSILNNAVDMLKNSVNEFDKTSSQIISDFTQDLFIGKNVIAIGTLASPLIAYLCKKVNLTTPVCNESYTVYVDVNPFDDKYNLAIIVGYCYKGALNGVADFTNKYLGKVVSKPKKGGRLERKSFRDSRLTTYVPKYLNTASPKADNRAIWTWGHVIYDYKNFFINMAKLRLNEIVIWNDFVPKNAVDIVNFAHSYGIKVIWGYSWGWVDNMKDADPIDLNDPKCLEKFKKEILLKYETEYLPTGGDGVYFQSFTETSSDSKDGKIIAQAVTEWVNAIASDVLAKYPTLKLQFGLHADSVKNRLEYIKNVDKRIEIIWENCGAFPQSYDSDDVLEFDDTVNFTKQISVLRGQEDKFGYVVKSMCLLDWELFKHQQGSYIMGEADKDFIKNYSTLRDQTWRVIQSYWLKNYAYVYRYLDETTSFKKGKINVQALVEDGVFEYRVPFAPVLYSMCLWDDVKSAEDAFLDSVTYRCVVFS